MIVDFIVELLRAYGRMLAERDRARRPSPIVLDLTALPVARLVRRGRN